MVKLRAMFPRKIKVCDAFGIPVYLDFSLIILLILFATNGDSFARSISCALMLLVSITAHELGHALTARAFGYGTRDITLSLLGGCASLIALPRKAWQEFLTAIAGPAVSFSLAVLAFLALLFIPVDEWTRYLLSYAAGMNVILGAFNLLPGFPMDGGRVFRSVASVFTTRTKATYIAMIVGRGFAILLALRGFAILFLLVLRGGLHLVVTQGGWGFISILIAWMIWREGYREYQMARMEESARSWGNDWSARVSPPPYGGDGDEVEIRED